MAHPLPFSDQQFDRCELERWQLEQLNALIARARSHSVFHRDRLPEQPLASLDEIASLPLMDAGDLVEHGDMLLVPAQRVARMVSLPTSGTSGSPKRIAFSEEDVRQTREFFASGLHCICRADEKTGVLFPSVTPGGMGSLICMSVESTGAQAVPVDLGGGIASIAETLSRAGATSAVGSGHLLLALARYAELHPGALALERVLVSSDNASRSMMTAIESGLGCEVFEHYGMTETGFGCSVDCHAHAGMHIREFDLLVEIIDPETGRVLPDGEEGEVVVTTLRREALPVIRYRMGDISRIVPGNCPCGGSLRRLDRVRGHALTRPDGEWRLEAALDEAVFSLPGVIDYDAHLSGGGAHRKLSVTIESFGSTWGDQLASVLDAGIPLEVEVVRADENAPLKNPKLSRLH